MARIANLLPRGAVEATIAVPAGVLREGVAVEVLHTLAPAGLAGDAVALAIKDLTFVEAGLRAQRLGFDAAIVNTFCDYGVAGLRSAASIPVVGAGESALAHAQLLGRKFSIVTVWPESSGPMYERVLDVSGARARCRSVRHVYSALDLARTGVDTVIEAAHAGKAEAVSRIAGVAEEAVRLDGADVIVLGCTCMSGSTAALATRLGVPVIDPLAAAFLAVQALMQLRAPPSVSAYPRTSDAHIAQTQAMVEALAAQTADAEPEACPVCAVA